MSSSKEATTVENARKRSFASDASTTSTPDPLKRVRRRIVENYLEECRRRREDEKKRIVLTRYIVKSAPKSEQWKEREAKLRAQLSRELDLLKKEVRVAKTFDGFVSKEELMMVALEIDMDDEKKTEELVEKIGLVELTKRLNMSRWKGIYSEEADKMFTTSSS